jgi:hypothetical protein
MKSFNHIANRLAHAINNPLQILTNTVFLAKENERRREEKALAQDISGRAVGLRSKSGWKSISVEFSCRTSLKLISYFGDTDR